MQLPDVTVAFGFSVALEVSVGGEIFKNNIRQPNSSITLSGKLEFNGLAISGILSMVGMWRKVFGVSFIAIGQLTLGYAILNEIVVFIAYLKNILASIGF